MPKSSILVSSDHNSFTHFSSESLRCLLANFRRACTCAFLSRGTLRVLQDFSPSRRSVLPTVFLVTMVPAVLRSLTRSSHLSKMALLCSAAVQVAPLRLCFYLLFYLLLISLFTHITSALITYDKSTLLDIGNRFTNLVQDTLSPNPSWPLEILRNAENKGHRRRNKKHRGNSAGIRNRLRKRAHSPPLPSILLANVQSLENKMDDLRARISFQRDIRDCNIICLSEAWLTPSVPGIAVTPSDNFSVLRMDRTAEAGKSKGGGVCFMTNKKWCDPRNISSLSRSCSPHLEHLSIIYRYCCLHSTSGRHRLGFV